MSKVIRKKVNSEFFDAYLDGKKRFEIRLGNEEYEVGDMLVLLEKDSKGNLTGREVECEILYNINTKRAQEFYTLEDIDKHGLNVITIRKKHF